jgi:hypothetical protein
MTVGASITLPAEWSGSQPTAARTPRRKPNAEKRRPRHVAQRRELARARPRKPARHCTALRCPESRALALPGRWLCQACAGRLAALGEHHRKGAAAQAQTGVERIVPRARALPHALPEPHPGGGRPAAVPILPQPRRGRAPGVDVVPADKTATSKLRRVPPKRGRPGTRRGSVPTKTSSAYS